MKISKNVYCLIFLIFFINSKHLLAKNKNFNNIVFLPSLALAFASTAAIVVRPTPPLPDIRLMRLRLPTKVCSVCSMFPP